MKQKLFSSICLVLAIVIVVTTSTTFAYLIASSENTTDVSGKTADFNVKLALTTVHKSTNMVPLKDSLVVTSIKNTNKYTLLDINIKTGRKNQIRATLSSLGHPLIGDKKYGATKNPISRLGLHNYYLKFNHPITNAQIELTTKVPKEFAEIFEIKKISS